MLYDAPHYVSEPEKNNKRRTPQTDKKKKRGVAELFQSRLSDYK